MQCCSSPESHERVRCIGLPCWIRNQDRRGPKSHRECTPTRTAWSEAHESLTLNSIPVFYMARADVRVTKSRGLRTAGFFNYLHWTIRPDSKILHEWLIAVCGCAQLGRSVPSPGRRAVEGGRSWVCSVLEWAAPRMGWTAPAKRRAYGGYQPRYRSRGTRPVHNSPSLWRLRWVPRHTSAVYTVVRSCASW